MACYNIYSDQLSTLKRGYALWEADPAGSYDQVEVGDVGYIFRGSFERLFNILRPANHPSQSRGVPECFEPLTLPENRTTKCLTLPAGEYMSRRVRHVDVTGGVSRYETRIPTLHRANVILISIMVYKCGSWARQRRRIYRVSMQARCRSCSRHSR